MRRTGMSTVLVVDDQAELRQLFQRVLESQGYRVVCAENGHAGLAMLDTVNPQLILLDNAMPQMDGMAFLRNLRKRPRFQNMPVIILSGLMSREQIQAARDLGVTDHLVKAEFTMKELRNRVARLLPPPTADLKASA
jgi:two-component system alkaline phosphatase synthesis response regulator PhoP